MSDVLKGLSASELMAVWERGDGLDDAGRAVLLLSHGLALPLEEAARLDIGRRDQRLLALRIATFGSRLETFLSCEQCGEALEFTVDARGLLGGADAEERRESPTQVDGITMRLPDSADFAAASRCHTVDEARRLLYERCVSAVDEDATALGTEEGIEQFGRWLEEVAPEVDVVFAVDCPACGAHREAYFDIVSFFWREIESACGRLVREVDALARTYGWSEAQILGMSSARRSLYVEAVSA